MSDENDELAHLRKRPARASRGGNSNGHGWKQRKIETLTCPSGEVVQIRRPGPDFTLRAGRVAKTFSEVLSRKPAGDLSQLGDGLTLIAGLSDSELAAVMIFARELVCTMLVSPRLVQNPRPGTDEVGPDDIGDDFWFLFNYGMGGFLNLPVSVGNQEVEVGDLESFRPESGVSGDSVDGAEVRTDPEQPVGDPGLVAGA